MIIFELKLKDFMQFSNASIDFTYPRESKFSPISQSHSKYPNLKFKKFGLILGANASGKTSFGKILCTIQNFLRGINIKSNVGFIDFDMLFKSKVNKLVEWDVVFAAGTSLYRLNVKINETGIVYESWKRINLSNKSYSVLKENLDQQSFLYQSSNVNMICSSALFGKPEFQTHTEEINNDNFFSYSFSDDLNATYQSPKKVDTKLMTKIMRSFDTSIKTIEMSQDIEGELIVSFNNDYRERIGVGGKPAEKSILSTGTKESIYLSLLVFALMNNFHQTIYLDERMSHAHSEIEQQIIEILVTLMDGIDGQLFITSHNADLFDMEFPNYNFILMKKDKQGLIISPIEPEKTVKHQNRSLRKVVNDDVFGTSPDLDELIELHTEILEKTL